MNSIPLSLKHLPDPSSGLKPNNTKLGKNPAFTNGLQNDTTVYI